MALSPSSEDLRALTPVERLNFRIIHGLNSSVPMRRVLTILASTLGAGWVNLIMSRVVIAHDFHNFEKIDPERGVLLVVNHRSFMDQFAVTARLFRLYGAHHNVYFPIRANFFYDNPLALLVNLPTTMAVMYPPIIRDKKRRQWNRYATDLMADILLDQANMIGFHPEGTRNRGSDPYALLPPKPGCGELIYRSKPNVIPVFLQGFPRSPFKLIGKNWFKPSQPLVHMVMGEPMDFSHAHNLEATRKTYLQISQKVMEKIQELSEKEKQIRIDFDQESSKK